MNDKSEPTLLAATAALLKAARDLAKSVTTSADHPDGVEWLYRAPYDNAQMVTALYRAIDGFYTLDGAPRFPELAAPAPVSPGAPAPIPPHRCPYCEITFTGTICPECGAPWSYPRVYDFDLTAPVCPECGGTHLTLTGKQTWQTVARWQAGDCDQVDTRDCYGWSGKWIIGRCLGCGHQFGYRIADEPNASAPEAA